MSNREAEHKKRDEKRKGILGIKRKSKNQLKPFGKYADIYSSDSSDSDYVPDVEVNCLSKGTVTKKHERKDSSKVHTNKKSRKGSCIEQDHEAQTASANLSSSVGTERKSGWNTLPTEILVKIFSFFMTEKDGVKILLSCSKMCKQWHYASQHQTLWRKADLSFMSNWRKANDQSVIQLMKNQGKIILEINLNNWKKLTDKGMMVISNTCPQLESLSISECTDDKKRENSITSQSILSIIEHCNLKNVDFSWLKNIPRSATVMNNLMEKHGGQLHGLNLCGCPVRNPVFSSIMVSCPNLRVLDISKTFIHSVNVRKLQVSCPHLEELYMANPHLQFSRIGGEIKEDACFKNLVALSVQCSSLADKTLEQLLKGASGLKLLDLRCCTAITTNGLENLEANGVERLFLSRACNTFDLETLFKKWQNTLCELDLSWSSCSSHSLCLENSYLERIARLGYILKNLAKLDLSGTAVSDESLKTIISMCPSLMALDLTSCRGVSRGLKRKHDKRSIDNLRN